MSTSNSALTALRTTLIASTTILACLLSGIGCNGPNRPVRRNEAEAAAIDAAYWPKSAPQRFNETRYAALRVAPPEIQNAEYVNDDQLCMTCHEAYTTAHQQNVHRGQACEQCHGPASLHLQTRGKEPGTIFSFKQLPPPQRAELCLKCHEENACSPGSQWRTSPHAHHGVSCTDCHTQHYNVPPGTPPTQVADASPAQQHQLVSYLNSQPQVDQAVLRAQSNNLGAVTPQICFRCHSSMAHQQDVAHPHQICGATGFDCATCHNPHGRIREETRSELCLQCHNNGTPTMAWHSSTHALYGVGCTDCHNPHPSQNVPQVVNINHFNIRRPNRLPMSVNDPFVCYKCHANVYAMNALPSHHPIKEGKMVCGDCHDGHGQQHKQLREPTVNLVCYRCHADKQGPFVYEHPPVTEDCSICHQPHGTVANNLLKQPATFLCLRCHSGHRTGPTFGPHTREGLVDVGVNPNLQQAFYTNCTNCHAQIHGSDLRSPHVDHAFFR